MHRRFNPGEWFYSFIPFKVSMGGAAPLVPLLVMDIGGGPADVGVVNAIGSTASMIGGLFWGKLSDRLNRRKVFLVTGFLGTAISTLLFPLAHSVHQIMVINAIYTFFIAATIPIPILIITKVFRLEEWDWAIGRFNEIGGWAWVGGMVIGLLLDQFLSLREIFIFLGIIGFFSVPWGLRTIREVPLHLSREKLGVYASYVVEKFRYIPNMITHLPKFSWGQFRGLYFSTLLFWVGGMLYFTQFPVLLKAKGFDTSAIYLMSIGNSAVSAFMYTRVGKRLQKGGGYETLVKGLLFRTAAFVIIPIAIHVESMFAILAFISYLLAGYTWAFIGISTTSIISHEAKAEERGTLIGTYNIVSSIGAIAGNFVSGLITEYCGFIADFSIASLLIALSIVPLLGEKVKSPKKQVLEW